jgi:hypothetical protein
MNIELGKFANLFSEREPAINLRNANDYYLPLPRTEAFKKSIAYSLPFSWN